MKFRLVESMFKRTNESASQYANREDIPYSITDDIELICDLMAFGLDEFSYLIGVPVDALANIDNYSPNRDVANKVYDFAFSNGIYLNEIKWTDYKEQYNERYAEQYSASEEQCNHIVLSHGSRSGIWGDIRVDVSGDSNDFANGFYCGESLRQAGMFVSAEPEASLYVIDFNKEGLVPLNFNLSTEWMLAIAFYRNKITQYANHPRIKSIIDSVNGCDYIIAPIADNKMFEIIDAFTNGEITDTQCAYALSATYLGKQYVMKTERAASQCKRIDKFYMCPLEKSRYSHKAEEEMNTSIHKATVAKKKYRDSGKYIFEILN